MESLISFFRPPEDTPRQMRNWCYGVAVSLTILMAGLGWAYGPKGFATEATIKDQVKAEVEQQVKPIAAAQQEQAIAQKKTDQKVDRIGILLIENLATTKAAAIRLVVSKKCKTLGFAERDELQREIERLQGEYFDLKGSKYDAPTCSEL